MFGIAYVTNRQIQGEYVQFNVVPKSVKTDQWIVSEPLVHEIPSHHIMATPQETGLTSPPNERHIPLYAQEPSPLSRQGCAQQTYTSHGTTYQYPNSSIIPNQESPNLILHPLLVRYHICIKLNSSFPPAIKRQCAE